MTFRKKQNAEVGKNFERCWKKRRMSNLNRMTRSNRMIRMLAAKQRDPAADTRAIEAEIDRLVYALYGLTPEEIAIVEGKQV